MKYGWRERISGALILLALAVIFLPLLFDDPAPREERPQPLRGAAKRRQRPAAVSAGLSRTAPALAALA